ncbi:relaxase/mobilization nuclease domain-containing protein [Maridesulfovibrio sp.]|uniref:relaxase/mobilization nuclease domain-containing protein n=1 Tax=Maridesulfovibrio sp. TaxID=2795000 RepID=UPI0029F54554|nr:relaxase/mobilization nuclease domain-containing protein [Maridesulfovibrio sp.]
MYMKVFAHGQGDGAKAVNYVIDPKRKGREESPPEVLRGDPEIVRMVIGSTDRKWKYTSGVLSWAPEDQVSPETEKKIMEDFEKTAFAGMEPDQYSVLWVRHSHAGHHEMHFIIPRTELTQDKAMNACPPGWQKQYDVWRDLWNERMEWARPDDPKRARVAQPGKEIQFDSKNKRAELKQQITDYLAQGISKGVYQNRDDLIEGLENVGFSIPRKGKNYITLESPQDGQRIRMKGGIYAASWRADKQVERAGEITVAGNGASRTGRISRLERELEEVRSSRAEYNQKRYGRTTEKVEKEGVRNFGLSLEAKFAGKFPIRFAASHSFGLHNRILRLENQGESRGVNNHQHTNSKPEEEYKQIYSMEDQRLPDRESKISGFPQGNEVGNNTHRERKSCAFTKEVDYERVKSELIGGPSQNREGAKPQIKRAGQEDCRADKGGSRLPGLAERLGKSLKRVGAVVGAFARLVGRKRAKNKEMRR